MKGPRILGVILARGGSKSVPRKNIRPLAGLPLIAYTIREALKCRRITRLVVSTEDPEIADVAKKFGAQVPFLRPAELATDKTPSKDCLQHAVRFVEAEEGRAYDFIVELMCTNPLKTVEDIDAVVDKLVATGAESVIGMARLYDQHPARVKRIVDDRIVDFCVPEPDGAMRQDLQPPAYIRNGSIYAMRRDALMVMDRRYGTKDSRPYVFPDDRTVNIDSEADWHAAEAMMKKREPRPLTGADFWDDFWKKTTLPVLPDPAKSYERCYLDLFERHFRPDPGRTVFEAGCAPGMWLAHFHRRFGYAPYGCDISPRGLALTEENLKLCGAPAKIAACDLFSFKADKPFDVVLSINFIEHFDNPWPVLDRQVELLAPGGTLVLSVPNLTRLNAWLTRPAFLAAHNQAVMNKAFFEDFAARSDLRALFLGYIGGFEPDLVGPERSALLRRGVLKTLRILRGLPGAGRVNAPFFSAFLVGVFRKPS